MRQPCRRGAESNDPIRNNPLDHSSTAATLTMQLRKACCFRLPLRVPLRAFTPCCSDIAIVLEMPAWVAHLLAFRESAGFGSPGNHSRGFAIGFLTAIARRLLKAARPRRKTAGPSARDRSDWASPGARTGVGCGM